MSSGDKIRGLEPGNLMWIVGRNRRSTMKQTKGSKMLSAIKYNKLDLVTKLIESGIDLDEEYMGRTPLQVAAYAGRYEVAAILLLHGADPNIQGVFGATALHLATTVKDNKMMLLLLDYKADPWIEDEYDRAVFDIKGDRSEK